MWPLWANPSAQVQAVPELRGQIPSSWMPHPLERARVLTVHRLHLLLAIADRGKNTWKPSRGLSTELRIYLVSSIVVRSTVDQWVCLLMDQIIAYISRIHGSLRGFLPLYTDHLRFKLGIQQNATSLGTALGKVQCLGPRGINFTGSQYLKS